ncbi:MAG: hypothetical protein ABI779_20110 [Acidobacteriota bacterium]
MAKTVEMLSMEREKVTLEEILEEVLARPRVHLNPSSADIIRELRGPLPDENVADR